MLWLHLLLLTLLIMLASLFTSITTLASSITTRPRVLEHIMAIQGEYTYVKILSNMKELIIDPFNVKLIFYGA